MASRVRLSTAFYPFKPIKWKGLMQWGQALFAHLQPAAESTDYQAWRQQFLYDRLRLCLWIAIPCFLTLAAHSLYIVIFNFEKFTADVTRLYASPAVAMQFRHSTLAACLVMTLLLGGCVMLHRTLWAKRHPTLFFLCFSWTLTLTDPLIGTFFGIPGIPGTFEFLAQATLMPVHWRLHLLSQIVPILYYIGVYPILGLTTIGDRSIYDAYAIAEITNLFWVCLISDLSVYLYERLKRSEFEAQRQLRVLLHSVSHDLQTPVMGTTMVLTNLLTSPQEQIVVHRSVLERLLQGSDRQSTLINSLLEAHRSEVQAIQLDCKPVYLNLLVESVLSDLQPALTQHQIQLINRIQSDLPPVHGDAHHLWRVFCNLLSNALKHNPNGITLTLNADVIEPTSKHDPQPRMRCTIQDNGIGIPPQQCQRLFELYARGTRARYMPGLGLGLYLCRQIVQAHGGEIGVISRPDEGATFWFTLPLVLPHKSFAT